MPNDRCRKCKAPIEWCKMPSGEWMPMDALGKWIIPDEHGPDKGFRTRELTYIRGKFLPLEQTPRTPEEAKELGAVSVWVSHFQTCTDPNRFSRQARERAAKKREDPKPEPKPAPPVQKQQRLF